MEKSVEWQFEAAMQEIFQLREVEIQEYSPLTLAYICLLYTSRCV